ncbi:MAG: transporter, partial [Cryptosporangiaceae bacterium]|nr:transporter [Cryptosporangiaceae bacterium]
RIGFRDTALIGSAVIVSGTVVGAFLGTESAVWMVAAACFVIGVGLGLSSSPTLVAVQSVVGWERRGVVTGTNMFCRSVGSAVGVAIFGAIANATLADRFAHPPAAIADDLPGGVDATSLVLGGQGGDGPVTTFVRGALSDASHHVFLGLVVVAVLGLAALLMMPRRTTQLELD